MVGYDGKDNSAANNNFSLSAGSVDAALDAVAVAIDDVIQNAGGGEATLQPYFGELVPDPASATLVAAGGALDWGTAGQKGAAKAAIDGGDGAIFKKKLEVFLNGVLLRIDPNSLLADGAGRPAVAGTVDPAVNYDVVFDQSFNARLADIFDVDSVLVVKW